MKYAREIGIHIMNVTEWNNFLRMREKVTIEELDWDSVRRKVSFKVMLKEGNVNVSLLIPLYYHGFKVTISVNGRFIRYNEVQWYEYAVFNLTF